MKLDLDGPSNPNDCPVGIKDRAAPPSPDVVPEDLDGSLRPPRAGGTAPDQ